MNGPNIPEPARKILLVEDEEFLRRIFKSRLMAEGYEVIDVGSAEGALDWLKHSQPHLIILDLYLPKMNGFEFLKRLGQDPGRRNTPVLILSGLGQETEIRRGLELGAREFVVKTKADPRELLAKIRKMLNDENSGPPPCR
jgi:DNA-binding response OmpR family regulator